jgi:hypothetical protein
MADKIHMDISSEMWREYDWNGRIYRIEFPKELVIRTGGSTHRVVDNQGVVHCVPSVGVMGCVVRWKSKDGLPPVAF